MSWAVTRKTFRDTAFLLVILTLGIVLFDMAAVRMLVEASKDLALLKMWLDRPLVQFLVRTVLGEDLAGELTSTTMITFALGHPLYYALSWTLLLTIATGVIAGEIGRGTADLLLTLPLSRCAVYASTSVVWIAAAVLVSAAPLPGLWLGERLVRLHEPLEFARLWPVCVNVLALNLAIAAVTMLVSSLVSRRGTAVGVILAGLLVSDLINFLAPFWSVVRAVSFLGFLHYYRPLPTVRAASVPWGDVGMLLAVTAVAWLVGLWYFARRDIRAV